MGRALIVAALCVAAATVAVAVSDGSRPERHRAADRRQPAARAAVVPHYTGTVIESVRHRTGVAALDGTVVWNGDDGVRARRPDGRVRTIAPRSDGAGLELELGRDARGRLMTPVLRCRSARHCVMRRLDIGSGTETTVPGTSQPRARRGRAAIDGRRVVYTRGTRLYVRSGSGPALHVTLPRFRLEDGSPVPANHRRITQLDLRGTTIAAVFRVALDEPIVDSQLWLLRSGRPPRYIAHVISGGATSDSRDLLAPTLEAHSVVVWRRFDNDSPRSNYLTRYTLTGRPLGRATLGRLGEGWITAANWDGRRLYYTTESRGDRSPCTTTDAPPEQPGCPVVDAGPTVRPR